MGKLRTVASTVMQCITMQYNTMQYNAIQYNTIQQGLHLDDALPAGGGGDGAVLCLAECFLLNITVLPL